MARSPGSVDSTAASVESIGLGRPRGARGGGASPLPLPPPPPATLSAKEKAEGASQGEGRARPSTCEGCGGESGLVQGWQGLW